MHLQERLHDPAVLRPPHAVRRPVSALRVLKLEPVEERSRVALGHGCGREELQFEFCRLWPQEPPDLRRHLTLLRLEFAELRVECVDLLEDRSVVRHYSATASNGV